MTGEERLGIRVKGGADLAGIGGDQVSISCHVQAFRSLSVRLSKMSSRGWLHSLEWCFLLSRREEEGITAVREVAFSIPQSTHELWVGCSIETVKPSIPEGIEG